MEYNYGVGTVIQSARSTETDICGVLVEKYIDSDGRDHFDIAWSDSTIYTNVLVNQIMENRIVGQKNEQEILAWRLKYGT